MNGLPTLPLKTPIELDNFHNYKARSLNSKNVINFAKFDKNITLVVNIDIHDSMIIKELKYLSDLARKFEEDLVVLLFPSNQFNSKQTKPSENEIATFLNEITVQENLTATLIAVAPIKVNGEKSNPVYRYLCHTIPLPSDDPESLVSEAESITWSPVRRSDIGGNFEKFLVLPNGRPFKRYSSRYHTRNLRYDIRSLINSMR